MYYNLTMHTIWFVLWWHWRLRGWQWRRRMSWYVKLLMKCLRTCPTIGDDCLLIFYPWLLLVCSDSLPTDYRGCSGWSCSDWAVMINGTNFCDSPWWIFSCGTTSNDLIMDSCRKSCDNCGALQIPSIKTFPGPTWPSFQIYTKIST